MFGWATNLCHRKSLLIWGGFFIWNGETDQDIADALIPELEKQNEKCKKKIYELEQKKLKNRIVEEVNGKSSLPVTMTKRLCGMRSLSRSPSFIISPFLKKLQSFLPLHSEGRISQDNWLCFIKIFLKVIKVEILNDLIIGYSKLC